MPMPKKVYIPVDGIDRHEEFECWYEDGERFATVKGDFNKETDKVHILGRTGEKSPASSPTTRHSRWMYA